MQLSTTPFEAVSGVGSCYPIAINASFAVIAPVTSHISAADCHACYAFYCFLAAGKHMAMQTGVWT